MEFGVKRHEHRGPVAAGVSLGQRSANRAAIAHLDVSDAGGAVVQDWNLLRGRRVLNLGAAGHGTEAKPYIFFFDKGSPGDEVDVDPVPWHSEAALHQRNQALPAGQQL